jgi:hypothetical protein
MGTVLLVLIAINLALIVFFLTLMFVEPMP